MFNRSTSKLLPARMPASSEPLFSNPRHAWIGAALLLGITIAAIRFPDRLTLLEQLMQAVGLPLYSNDAAQSGWHFAGIIFIAAALSGFVLLIRSAARHKFLMTMAGIVFVNSGPLLWLYLYMTIAAPGIYAVDLQQNRNHCQYSSEANDTTFTCSFSANNRSRHIVEATASLRLDEYARRHAIHNDEVLELSAIPAETPVSLRPGSNAVQLEFSLPADQFPYDSGSGSGFIITLSDGSRSRTF